MSVYRRRLGRMAADGRPFLAGAVDLGLDEWWRGPFARGVVIPAHVDRPSFSLLSNLGLIPEAIDVQASRSPPV